MPIFEFRCLQCHQVFEKLFLRSDEGVEISCPECQSTSFERVVSRSSHVLGAGPGGAKATLNEKSCGPGNKCYTLDIPGPSR